MRSLTLESEFAAEGSRAKLADFDSARKLYHELTEAGLKPLGTKGFAFPEVSLVFKIMIKQS